MNIRSKIAAGIVAGLVAASIGLGVAVPADAATVIAPNVPEPLNVLPSTVVGSATATTTGDALAVLMYKWAKDPKFWQLAQAAQAAKTAGIPASADAAAAVAAEASSFTVPATAIGTLSKVIGPAGVAISGFQFGLSVGQGASRIMGFKDGAVCDQENGVLTAVATWLDNVDCNAYQSQLTASQQNVDTGSSYGMGQYCSSAGNCLTGLTGLLSQLGTVTGSYYGYACFASTGSNPRGVVIWHLSTDPAGTNRTANVYLNNANGGGAGCSGAAAGLMTAAATQATVNATLSTATMLCVSPGTTCTDPSAAQITSSPTNPARTFKCVLTGTSGSTYSASSPQFHETDQVFPQVTCPALPASDVLAHTRITEETVGGASSILYDQDSTPQYQAMMSNYPDCASGTCMLDLRSVVGAAQTSCFETPGPCAGWFTDPNKATDYACYYGTHAVALTECNVYAPTFKPDAQATGQAYADPRNGNSADVQTAPTPNYGASADPATGDDRPDCWPSGWGAFNPANWVLQPLQCAFSPRESVIVAAENQVSTAWKASSVGVLGTAIGGFFLTSPTSGCQGITIDTSWLGTGNYIKGAPTSVHMLAACPGDYFEHIAPIVNGLLTAGIAVMAVLAVARLLGRFAGYSGIEGD